MVVSSKRGVKRPKVVEESESSDSEDDQPEDDFEVEIKREEDEYLDSSNLEGDSFTAYPENENSMEIKEEDLDELDIKEEVVEDWEGEDSAKEKERKETKRKGTKRVKFSEPESESDNSDFSESDNEEDNFADDDSEKEEGEGKKSVSSGLANVMAKILGTKKSEDVILSKAKTDKEVKKTMKLAKQDTFEIVDSSGQVKKEPMIMAKEEEEDRKQDISLHDREIHSTRAAMERTTTPDDLQQKVRYSTEEENRLLLSLLTEQKDVLFSKKTDHNMITKKQQAWTRITEKFNVAGVGPYKTCKQLKRMWEHKQSRAKKTYIEDKKERMKTGGGPPKEHNDPTVEEILALIGSELTPLTNMFDSDVQKDTRPAAAAALPYPRQSTPPAEVREAGERSSPPLLASDLDQGAVARGRSLSPTADIMQDDSGPEMCAEPTPRVTHKRVRYSPPQPSTATNPGTTPRRHTRTSKFSVQDVCYKEILRMKKEEHKISMQTKQKELEAANLSMQTKQKELEAANLSMQTKQKELEAANQLSNVLKLWGEAALAVKKR